MLAGVFLFAAVRRATQSSAAAFAAVGIFALNPNLLYLQATPMTEPVFLAGFMALLYCTVLFRDTQSLWAVAGAGIASLAASLSRYEGWFLIPFVTSVFLVRRAATQAGGGRGIRRDCVARSRLLAGAQLVAVLAIRWNFTTARIRRKASISARSPSICRASPGDHDWKKAWLFFRTTARIVRRMGRGVGGSGGPGWRDLEAYASGRCCLAAIPPVFYVWRMYAGESPIFVPRLWFSSYYNTRYGLSALPLLAIAGAGVVLLAPNRLRPLLAACCDRRSRHAVADPSAARTIGSAGKNRRSTQTAAAPGCIRPRSCFPPNIILAPASTPASATMASAYFAKPEFRCATPCATRTNRLGWWPPHVPICSCTKNGRSRFQATRWPPPSKGRRQKRRHAIIGYKPSWNVEPVIEIYKRD